MRTILITSMVVLISSSPAWSGAAGLVKINTLENRILSGELTMDKYFNAESIMRQGDDLEINKDIYEFGTKSPFKAFMFSLAVPGAGEFYTGKKYRAVGFLTADVLFWTGYFIYRGKGNGAENDYQAYADKHYDWQNYQTWWGQLPDSLQEIFSHRMPYDYTNNVPIFDHEYYREDPCSCFRL